jgi:hypothetical protein
MFRVKSGLFACVFLIMCKPKGDTSLTMIPFRDSIPPLARRDISQEYKL